MNKTLFLRVKDVAQMLDVSPGYAYKLIRQLNAEQESQGYLTMSGRVNREYFMAKNYGSKEVNENACI